MTIGIVGTNNSQGIVSEPNKGTNDMSNFLKGTTAATAAVVALSFAAPVATPANAATVINFDVTGIDSYDEFGAAINEVFFIDIGAFSHVIGIGWNVTLLAASPGWLDDMAVAFSLPDISAGFVIRPGAGDMFSGAKTYSSGGIVDVVGLGLDFTVGADGLLRLEFWETFADYFGAIDGVWQAGTLSIQYAPEGGPGAVVPELATWAMLIAGFGLVGFAVRRRRSTIAAA